MQNCVENKMKSPDWLCVNSQKYTHKPFNILCKAIDCEWDDSRANDYGNCHFWINTLSLDRNHGELPPLSPPSPVPLMMIIIVSSPITRESAATKLLLDGRILITNSLLHLPKHLLSFLSIKETFHLRPHSTIHVCDKALTTFNAHDQHYIIPLQSSNNPEAWKAARLIKIPNPATTKWFAVIFFDWSKQLFESPFSYTRPRRRTAMDGRPSITRGQDTFRLSIVEKRLYPPPTSFIPVEGAGVCGRLTVDLLQFARQTKFISGLLS